MTENQLVEADLIIEARWVVPIVPHDLILERHSVVISLGRIIDLLPTEQARNQYHAIKTNVLDEHVLIPGLINLHTHAAMTLMRGMADDLQLMAWLKEHIWPAEAEVISPKFVRDGTLLASAEMLAGGTTTYNDMYFYPASAAEASVQAGIRANLGLVIIEFPSSYASDADDYIQKGLDARDGWRGQSLITSSIAPHAPYTISDNTFEKVVTYAEQLGLGIHTHLHETKIEIEDSLKEYGMTPIQRLSQLGVLGPNLVAAHGVHIDEVDTETLISHGCHLAHCPASNLKLASGIAPISRYTKAGINIGIGTDGAASNNRLDMFSEMRLAALLAKGQSGDAASIPAHQALRMATINGAKALGLENRIGSIEIGKMADLAAIKLSSIQTQPCFDPVSHLVYAAGREQVTHTWVDGELRYQDGVYASIEPAELKEITSVWQSKLAQFK